MKKVKSICNTIWNEFIYGGHVTSIGAASIVLTSAITLKIAIEWKFLLVVYLWTHAVYSYNRLKELKYDALTEPKRTNYIKKNQKYIRWIIPIFIIVATAIILTSQKFTVLLLGFSLLLLSLLYTLFLKKITKKIPDFKSFFVAIIWAGLILFLCFYYSYPLNLKFLLIATFVFLRVLAHEEFLNLKDKKADKKAQLYTIANHQPQKKMLKIIHAINVLSSIPIIAGVYLQLLPVYSLAIIITIPYLFYCLESMKANQKNQNLTYIADAEFIFWTFFILIGQHI